MNTNKGIIVACPRKYEHYLLKNITFLRTNNCNLPIEIWEIDKEISDCIRVQLETFLDISFKNVNTYTTNANHWKGFQIKAFILKHTQFDNVILMDADVLFFKNPEIIFKDKHYIETGTYFFKDLDSWTFNLDKNTPNSTNKWYSDKFSSIYFFNKRKQFIQSLLPNKPTNFPIEWDYIYDKHIPDKQVKEALQESGVVYMNRKLHKKPIEMIYQLNDNHKETYQYIWGDKETFWLGVLMAGNKFYFNETSGVIYESRLTHFYNNSKFWKQK